MTTSVASAAWVDDALAVDGSVGPLALRHYPTQGGVLHARVVVAAAIGVPQTFYAAFATWLAQRGYTVTTFDYRGHAASLHGPLRRVQADLMDWAHDCTAVAAHLQALDAAAGQVVPLLWVGHSVGAQLPGLCQPPLPVAGLLAIASGSGYWRDNAPPTRRKVRLWWWGVAPLVTAVCGCLPGKRLGLVGDLPAGVLWQWRRWCLHPEYSLGVEGDAVRRSYAAARYPVHAMAVEDDEMMSLRSTQSLVGWYRSSRKTIERVRCSDAGAARIGHFGFFRTEMAATLWPRAEEVLSRWVAQGAAVPQSGRGIDPLAPAGQGGDGNAATVVRKIRTPPAPFSTPGQDELFTEAP